MSAGRISREGAFEKIRSGRGEKQHPAVLPQFCRQGDHWREKSGKDEPAQRDSAPEQEGQPAIKDPAKTCTRQHAGQAEHNVGGAEMPPEVKDEDHQRRMRKGQARLVRGMKRVLIGDRIVPGFVGVEEGCVREPKAPAETENDNNGRN